MKAGEIPLDQYTINKQLTKDPAEYGGGDESATRGLAHVQVALRYNKTLVAAGGKPLQRGDTVQYVVCTVDSDGHGPDGVPHTQRAWHYEEVLQRRRRAEQQQNTAAKFADEPVDDNAPPPPKFVVPEIDINYYLSNQLHPVISRLVEPIDGTSAAIIGQCLGLDAAQIRSLTSHHAHADGGDNNGEGAMLGAPTDAERFASCEPFKFRCGKCLRFSSALTLTKPSPLSTPNLSANSVEVDLALERPCVNTFGDGSKRCGWRALPDNLPYVMNELENAVKVYVNLWKAKTYVCSSLACGRQMQQHGIFTLVCRECGRESLRELYSEKELYLQLLFFRKMFELKEMLSNLERIKPSPPLVDALRYKGLREPLLWDQYEKLKKFVDEELRKVYYANVSFDVFFPKSAKVKVEEEEIDSNEDEPMKNPSVVQSVTPVRKMPGGGFNTSVNSSGGRSLGDVSFVPETPLRNGVYSHDSPLDSPMMNSPLGCITNSTKKKFRAMSLLQSVINNSDGNEGIGGIRSDKF